MTLLGGKGTIFGAPCWRRINRQPMQNIMASFGAMGHDHIQGVTFVIGV